MEALLASWDAADAEVAARWRKFDGAVQRRRELEAQLAAAARREARDSFAHAGHVYTVREAAEPGALTQAHVRAALHAALKDKALAQRLFERVVATRPSRSRPCVVRRPA